LRSANTTFSIYEKFIDVLYLTVNKGKEKRKPFIKTREQICAEYIGCWCFGVMLNVALKQNAAFFFLAITSK